MSEKRRSSGCNMEEMELRKGPWTLEEDSLLIHYIACHGEGRWNLLARASGLKRTGKSCRLRWMNYLKPDIKKGNLTPEEQLLILELHSKLGNRWSRIAQHLPGRTDNEIKNYWRTRVQKQARQLRVDANSTMFRDAVRCFWKPRLRPEKTNSPQNSEHANTNVATVTDVASATEITKAQQQLYHLPNCQDHHQMISNITTLGNTQHLDFESSFTSSCSAVLPQLFLPSRSSSDELSNVVTFSPFSGGYSTSWDDQALVSATALAAAADCDFGIDDGLWCMDELHDMFKGYTSSSGAQAKVLSGL